MLAVHIGFPKTATTFLQTAVFPQVVRDGFAYFGKEQSERLLAPLIDDDDTIFDAPTTRARLRASVAEAENALFSYEGLTGHHYRSGFVNRSQIARRLKQVGFDRVVVTIRNQLDVLESAYKQYVKSGGVLRFDDYITFDAAKPRYLHPRYFDYALVHELYSGIFGVSNVLFLQYERLFEPDFASSLAAFLGVSPLETAASRPANRSLSYEKTAVLRACNHLAYSSYRPSSLVSKKFSTALLHRCLSALPFGNGGRSFVNGATYDAIAAFYADSNRRLARQAAITLARPYPGSALSGPIAK